MNENKLWRESSNKIRLFEEEVLSATLPHASFSTTTMFGSPDYAPSSFSGELSYENIFKDTQYEYKGSGNFVHFTSVKSLVDILKSGYLRMSEFSSLEDKNELVYAARILNSKYKANKIDIYNLDEEKQNLFCLSACEFSESTQKNIFLWETYGIKGNGVLIEYKFTNSDLFNFILGKVLYGKEELNILEGFITKYTQFVDKYGFSVNDYSNLLIELQAFHKAKRYLSEDEVRLFYKKDDLLGYGQIYNDLGSNNEVKNFIKLFIKPRHEILRESKINLIGEENILRIFPQVEIKKIVLGYGIDIHKKWKLAEYLNQLNINYGYEFEICHIDEELEIYIMNV